MGCTPQGVDTPSLAYLDLVPGEYKVKVTVDQHLCPSHNFVAGCRSGPRLRPATSGPNPYHPCLWVRRCGRAVMLVGS